MRIIALLVVVLGCGTEYTSKRDPTRDTHCERGERAFKYNAKLAEKPGCAAKTAYLQVESNGQMRGRVVWLVCCP